MVLAVSVIKTATVLRIEFVVSRRVQFAAPTGISGRDQGTAVVWRVPLKAIHGDRLTARTLCGIRLLLTRCTGDEGGRFEALPEAHSSGLGAARSAGLRASFFPGRCGYCPHDSTRGILGRVVANALR